MLTLVLRETLDIWDATPCVLVYVNRSLKVTSIRIVGHGSEVRTREIRTRRRSVDRTFGRRSGVS